MSSAARAPFVIAVLTFLSNQSDLNLTAFENATVRDNFIFSIELAPAPKQQVLAYLDQLDSTIGSSSSAQNGSSSVTASSGPEYPPERMAIAVIVQGRTNPPRVIQVYCDRPSGLNDCCVVIFKFQFDTPTQPTVPLYVLHTHCCPVDCSMTGAMGPKNRMHMVWLLLAKC